MSPEARLKDLGVDELPRAKFPANDPFANLAEVLRRPDLARTPTARVPANDLPAKPIVFKPTPFVWRDPSTIPPRQFIYGRHHMRGFVSATVAPGGVGKSSLALVDAVAMASNRSLLGVEPSKPLRVWYVNLEDPREEIERRVAAICLHFDVNADELGDRLSFDGRELEGLVVAKQTNNGAVVATPVLEALTAALKDRAFDVLVVDPFVSVHQCAENDNNAIDMVAKTFGRLAGAANCAIELVHHTRKTGGQEITAEDGRGASALGFAARVVRVLNPMSKDEADRAGVGERRGFYFRSDNGMANLIPPSTKATWFNTQLAEIDNDFIKHLAPVAEFALQTPIHNGAAAGALTTGYFQPGVIYEADKWQIAFEARVPMTGATGHGVGVIGSLDFYLDDIPNRIDEPIFPHGLGIAPGI
jgi:hypothetical protein